MQRHANEAHNIKNRNTKAAVACCELEEKYRCTLNVHLMRQKTIQLYFRQNTVDELFSLLKFLRLRPLNDWQAFKTTKSQSL